MPKTRLTAKLCSTPTVSGKSPGSDGSAPTPSPSSTITAPAPPATTPTSIPLPSAAKSSPSSKAPTEKLYATKILSCASSIDFVLHKDECDTETESDSESDDDLPEGLSSKVSTCFPVKGDAVWVKYRSHKYWPSLVLHSNPKTQKLRIVFLDDQPMNGQHVGQEVYMKYNKQKIMPYHHENRVKFETEGKSQDRESRQKFEAALNKIVDYLNKRALGLSAWKLYLNEPVSSEDESNVTLQPPPAPSVPSQPAEETKRKRKKEDKDKEHQENRKKLLTPDERRAMRKERNQPIVDYICSTDMKNHLTKIFHAQTASERHQLFMQGRYRQIQTHSSGPIDDDDQLEQIINTIGKWHQELTRQLFPNMDYLLWVWLPEAIVYALRKVKHCSETKARTMFEKGIRLTKGEHLEIQNQLLRRW